MTYLPTPTDSAPVTYPLGKTAGGAAPATPAHTLRATLVPFGGKGEWLLQLHAFAPGKRTGVPIIETTPACPLASVAIGGDTYGLPITWHERKRGGVLCIGGTRRTGTAGDEVQWEMRWIPVPALPGAFTVEMRLRATPHRTGTLCLTLQSRLPAAHLWSFTPAARQGHCAQMAVSDLAPYALAFAALDGDGGWDDDAQSFALRTPRMALGGGKCLRAFAAVLPAPKPAAPRAALAALYAEAAGARLHSVSGLPTLNPLPAAEYLSNPAHYAAPGTERLYLSLPGTHPQSVQSGAPHYPLDALHALAQWQRFHPRPDAARLVRYGALGIAADCQVMGRGDEPEPNKGAFWDQLVDGQGSDAQGEPIHGIAANARMARALFLLHEETREMLLRQSALNICQWLLLKSGSDGWFDGAHVHASVGRATDGRVIPQPCALDGAAAIPALVLAFRATRNEVFIKAAAKIAAALLPRMAEMDTHAPAEVAAVLTALLALHAEAPQPRLAQAIGSWAALLRTLPLSAALPGLNADGLHSGLYDCAQAGFALFAHLRDLAFLRYAFHALSLVPTPCLGAPIAWRTLPAAQAALLSLAALLPQSRVDFDRHTVSLDWRCYAPDPATEQHIQVQGDAGQEVLFLPLVCRASDQVLLLVLAPPGTASVSVLKNGRRPLACDLLGGTFDTATPLHTPDGILWARIGAFAIDP